MPITQPAKKSPFGSLESILLKKQGEATPELIRTLSAAAQKILLQLKIKDFSASQLEEISKEIAQESLRQIFEEISRIQSPEQITSVIADSLSETLAAHLRLVNKLKTPQEEQIFEKATREASAILNSYRQTLEQIATLGHILILTKFNKPDYLLQSLIETKLRKLVEKEHPLAQPEVFLAVKNNIRIFLRFYLDNFEKKLAADLSKANIPSFEKLQKAKSAAFDETASLFGKNLAKYKSQISPKDLVRQLSYLLGLLPIPPEKELTLGLEIPPKTFPSGLVGFFVRMLLSPYKNQLQVYYSLLAYEKDVLEKTLKETDSQFEKLKSQSPRSLRQSMAYLALQKQQRILKNAQNFALSSVDDAKAYQSIFQNLSGITSLIAASQFAWAATEGAFGKLPGIYVPKDHLIADQYLAQKIIGGLKYGR